jgi:N,N'-diacetyllegionaminate synthase
MQIGGLNTTDKVMIIAEIGNNHEGNYERAIEMIKRAAESGVDAVKFQTFLRPEHFHTSSDPDRIQRLQSFQLELEQITELAEIARANGVVFFSTPLDIAAVEFLDTIAPVFKIASCDNNFLPLIDAISKTGKPVILSSGLADLNTLSTAKVRFEFNWANAGQTSELAILHCVSAYPTPVDQANLNAIRTIQQEIGGCVGYSDHTLGIDAAVLSVGLGARIIEKHFTIDKNLSDFRDHQLSADPGEMTQLVQRVREAEQLLGLGGKRLSEVEVDPLLIRRSVAANRNLDCGHILKWEDLTWVRPGTGVSPGYEHQLLGRTLKSDRLAGQLILLADVK